MAQPTAGEEPPAGEERAVAEQPGGEELRRFGEEVVVTATRTPRREADSPVPVGVLDRATLEATAARTLAEAVEWSAGVRVESSCQNCNVTQVRLLGLDGPYTQILVDGQPTVSSLALVYGLEQVPARLIDSIEVVKGGGSAIYGGGAVAGVINLIPHQPSVTGGAVEMQGLVAGGEPGTSLSAAVDWLGATADRTLTAFAQRDASEPVDRDGDHFSEVARRELTAWGLRYEQYAAGGRGRWSAELNGLEAARRGGDLARIDRPPHDTALTEWIATDRLGGSFAWLHTVAERFDYRLTTSYARTRRDSYYGSGFDPAAYGTTDNTLWVADSQANAYLAASTLTAGLQYTRDEIDDRQGGRGRRLAATASDLGAYLQDDRRLARRFTLVYGARVDVHSQVDEPIVSPRLAALWSPRDDLLVRASLATGFRPPAVFDEDLHVELVGGGEVRRVENASDLEEERSRAGLLSAEWRPTFGRRGSAALELHLFRTDLEGRFVLAPDDHPATPGVVELTRINFGDARVEGVELIGGARWGDRLDAELGWVLQSARHEEPEPEFGSRRFLRTPQSHGRLLLRWRLPRRLDLFAGVAHTGSMRVPHYAGFVAGDRLETAPSFTTVDLNLARTFERAGGRRLVVAAGGKNLTDAYQRDLDRGPLRDASYVYGPRFPRSWFVRLGFAWGGP
ncbi:MAG TPA: TonB-dependent receptor [Thermoanaerobaculia bacterium]|nr:TonB-dependent receptor [Thermoanaerobaculia bacterium]